MARQRQLNLTNVGQALPLPVAGAERLAASRFASRRILVELISLQRGNEVTRAKV